MSEKESKYREKQKKAARERYEREKQADRQKIIETLERGINEAKAAQQENAATEKNKEKWERKRFWLDVAAVTAVFLAAFFAFGQLIIMGGQLTEMRGTTTQIQQQITAANRLADNGVLANAGAQSIAADQRRETNIAIGIAKGQLATAQSTANKQLRAYLWVIATPIENFAEDQIPRWGIQYGAIGQTPAYNVQIHMVVSILGYPNTLDLKEFYSAKSASDGFKTVVFPGNTGSTTTLELACPVPSQVKMVRCKLDKNFFAAVEDASAFRIYALGYIAYQDSFGAPHRTPFCFNYNPNKKFGIVNEICDKTPKPD